MTEPKRHIARSKVQAHCGAPIVEKHTKIPGLPMALRRVCAKCLLAVNADRARRHGWRVKTS